MNSKTHKKSTLHFLYAGLPLFVVLFLDGMGLGIVFPILNGIVQSPASHFFTSAISTQERSFIYGIVIMVFMLCWFIGSTVLGDFSDKAGRKKALMLCLGGSALGYFLTALAVMWHALWLIFIGRIIDGFTTGSQPIAQASIIDLSHDEQKSRNLGLILMSLSLGFVLGPALGGLLSDPHVVSWFDYKTPLVLAGIISVLNMWLLQVMYKETYAGEVSGAKLRFSRAFKLIWQSCKDKRINALIGFFLINILSWSFYYSYISPFMMARFGFTTSLTAWFMAALGVGFVIGFGWLNGFMADRLSIKSILWISIPLLGVFIALNAYVPSVIVAWVCVILAAVCQCLVYAQGIRWISDQVNENEQGWVMGVTGSVTALGYAISAFLGGILDEYSMFGALTASVVLVLIALVALLFIRSPETRQDDLL
ncbi:MAG: MFS transporter [Coxiellaceae bacterium]|nr:MFS transporter [Coxiellaceae bacterium]